MPVHPCIRAARHAAPVLRENAAACERARRLTPDVVAALEANDLFRLCLPAVYGGPECDPVTYISVIETLAEADAAGGWCASISSTTATLSWSLPVDWAARIWATKAATGGAFAPAGKARRIDGGWLVDGRWSWGSGTQHAAWITGGTLTDDGAFHLMVFPREDVMDHDNWYSGGLKGTGSQDFEVTGAFVPDGRSVPLLTATPVATCPLAQFPTFSMLAVGVASTMLGMARRSIAELTLLANEKTPLFARSKLSGYVPAQLAVANAEAAVSSAAAFLREETHTAWQRVLRGDPVPVDQRARIRLACAYAAERCAHAVDLAYNAAGGTAVHETSPILRCHRDVHTATAHLMASDRNLLAYGRRAFGLDVDTSML